MVQADEPVTFLAADAWLPNQPLNWLPQVSRIRRSLMELNFALESISGDEPLREPSRYV